MFVGRLGVVGRTWPRFRRLIGLLPLQLRAVEGLARGVYRFGRSIGLTAEKMCEPVPSAGLRVLTAVQLAVLGRLAAGDENLVNYLGAGRRGELAALRIDCFVDEPGRRFKVLRIAVERQRDGALHEFRPDRSSGGTAR